MDLQFIQFNDTVDLSEVQIIPNFYPPTIQITGPDLTSVIEVQINGSKTPSFVVASSNKILAQIPAGAVGQVISSVVAISSDFTASLRSLLTFEIGDNPGEVSGIKALMQMWLKILLTTPGFDAFTKNLGGGAQQYVGSSYAASMSSSINASFAIAVQQTTNQVLALQAQQTRLPDDERLLTTEMLGLRYDPDLPGLLVRVALYTQSGKRALANMEL
jgi:hypothetical protein